MSTWTKQYFKCDRCGAEHEIVDPYLQIDYSMRVGPHHCLYRRQKEFYLCNKCRKDFVKFMRGVLKEDEW